jgi:type VI secretion system protein ImpJ
MAEFNKVVWSEGLFLKPHHFQQQERYLERFVETRCTALRSEGWGFIELEIERDLLAIGKLALRRATGVFPDGTPFRMPDDYPLPQALEIGTQVRDQVVYLATALRAPSALDVASGTSGDAITRHRAVESDVRDSTATSPTNALLRVANLQTQLMVGTAGSDGFARIPVAHIIECRSDRHVVLDDRFMPSVLDIRAARALAAFAAELLGKMHQQGETLAARVAGTDRTVASELSEFLMLLTINRYEPLVTHLTHSGTVHPEDFYRLCVSMAGELATFTTAAKRPAQLPGYRHEQLRESFEPVMTELRKSLSAEQQQNTVAIPIEARKFGVSVAVAHDRTLFGSAVFILAVRADVPLEELRRRFPSQVKIGPAEKIIDLVNLALPGIALHALPVVPRQIPFHAGFVYFELDQTHELWKQLKDSGGIALHVAGEFPGIAMKLWAVRG